MDRTRIHKYLDGEIAYAALDGHEQRQADRLEHAVEAAVHEARDIHAPDLADRIMAQVGEIQPRTDGMRITRSVRSITDWMMEPWEVSLRPAYAALAILLFAVASLLPTQDVAPKAEAQPEVYVQFRLDAPEAQTVALSGSFTDWSGQIELRETRPGVWTAMVPLEPGVHDYAFVVNGKEWTPDPNAPRVDDGFGGTNSRLSLLTKST